MRMRVMTALVVWLTATVALAVPQAPLSSANKPDLGKDAVVPARAPLVPVVIPVPAPGAIDAALKPDIARVEAHLSTITTLVANFSQTSADGSTGTGKFFMKRPGKMRWQYNPPTPLLLVSDGKAVTFYDAGLDQVSYIGVDDTLASFLARKDITLDSDSTRLTSFQKADGLITASLVQRTKPSEGSLTLEFSDNPLLIKSMVVVDATGNATRVTLADAQFGQPLSDKLFVFEDPRGVNYRRNRK